MNEEMKRNLASYGTTADQWRIEAHFAHINLPVIYATHDKMEAYERVGRMLAASGIQRVLVYKNGVLHQTITVETANQPHDDSSR